LGWAGTAGAAAAVGDWALFRGGATTVWREFDDLGNTLAFVLLGHLPVAQGLLLTNHLVAVLLEAFGVVGGDAVRFRLDLGVFLRFAFFKFLELFLLAGFVGVQGRLAMGRVLEQVVGRSAGGVEGHEHRGALDVFMIVGGCGRC